MDHRSKLVGVALLVCAGAAHAFVSPSPPPGFGGSAGGWTWTPPTPGQQLGGIMRGPGPSVAGSGPVNAAYRLGPSAARALARGIIGGGVAGAAVIGALWLAENCFEKQGGQWVRTCGAGVPEPSTGYVCSVTAGGGQISATFDNCQMAALSMRYLYDQGAPGPVAYCNVSHPVTSPCEMEANGPGGRPRYGMIVNYSASSCPAGWYVTPAGCVQNPPLPTVTPQQVEDEMAEKPLPQTMPPGIPLPLDPQSPSIWNPTETNPPSTRPMRIPQGNPVPIPNSDPAKWRQPVTRVEHSPTATDPWRMDTRPEDLITDSPTGQTGPETITGGSPPTTPKEETPDLCEKNPDIVACQKLGTLDALPVPNEDKQLGITKDNGWQENGTCPPAKTAHVLGMTLTFPWTTFCDFASMIRPLLIGFAWLSAALTFMGLGRRD